MRDTVPVEVSVWFWRLAGASFVVGLALFCGRFVEDEARAGRIALHSAAAPQEITTLSAAAPEALASEIAPPQRDRSGCVPKLTIGARDGAMLSVTVDAPCASGQRVEIRHGGLSLAETMPVGRPLHLSIPALEAEGRVAVLLDDGSVWAGEALVPDLDRYRRFAISWQGAAAVRLTGPQAEGWVTDLGNAGLETPLRAQVFTWPAAVEGRVTVDLAATPASCGQKLRGQTVVSSAGISQATGLSVDLPDCGLRPVVLHLKNLDQETKLAQG